jgi:hypothetical protein
MDDALNIAMDYLIRTVQAVKFPEAQEEAAQAVVSRRAWGAGVGCGFQPGKSGLGTTGRFTEERLASRHLEARS